MGDRERNLGIGSLPSPRSPPSPLDRARRDLADAGVILDELLDCFKPDPLFDADKTSPKGSPQ